MIKFRAKTAVLLGVCCGVACLTGSSAYAVDPALIITVENATVPLHIGDQFRIALSLRDLGANQAAGYQAFLQFDPTKIQLLNAAYTPVPFGLPVISPIAVNGGLIDVAAGIDQFNGQTPTTTDGRLVRFTFQMLVNSCDVPRVTFRAHNPPSRVTNPVGVAITPMGMIAPAEVCPADFDHNAVVGVTDLLTVINNWGPCPGRGICCPGDGNADGQVNVSDLLLVISLWGPCP